MARRRRWIIALMVVLPVLSYGCWAGYVRFIARPVRDNEWVGRTEARIRSSYGEPDEDWLGYQSLANYVPSTLPSGPIRTLVFHPRGLLHPEGGTLWVWVVARDGHWVCFESCWYASGVVF